MPRGFLIAAREQVNAMNQGLKDMTDVFAANMEVNFSHASKLANDSIASRLKVCIGTKSSMRLGLENNLASLHTAIPNVQLDMEYVGMQVGVDRHSR